jgi:predicted exporter
MIMRSMNLWFLRLYLLLHLLVLGFAVSGLPWKIDADMYSILPHRYDLEDVSKAESEWNKNNSANFMILIGGKNFETAKQAALLLYGEFAENNSLEALEIYVDSNAMQSLRGFFFENRMRLQTEEFVQALNTDINGVRLRAFSKIYGANPLISLDNIDDDPFLLGENGMEYIMGGQMLGSWEIRENMRVAKDNDEFYILINGKLAKNVSPVASKENVISKIREMAKIIEKEHDLHMAFSGIPFHINESSGKAGREVSAITVVSMLSVILLLFFAFRSSFPLIVTVGVTLLSALFAASAVHIVFGEIHIFTFVFGTSIIGLGLDYSIHFFSHCKAASADENGFGIRSKIILCLALGFFTTQLGYLALMTTRFPLLSQMAFFSFSGLLSVFLSVNVLYPYFKLPPQNKRILPGVFIRKKFFAFRKKLADNNVIRIIAFISFAVVLVLGFLNLKMKNNLQEFYTMSKKLQNSEMLVARITNAGAGLFYIVTGNSPEETLENEEILRSHLDSLGSYLAVSTFIPSAKSQTKVYNSINDNLLPLYAEQFMQIGFDSLTAKNKAIALREDFQRSRNEVLTVNSALPAVIRQTVDKLWIGEIDGKYYSAVLLLKIKDKELLKKMRINNAILVDKRNEVETELTALSEKIIYMMLAAYAGSLLFLSFIYNFKSSVKILAIPLLASATAIAIISLSGISMSFFAVAGMILTLAIGVDYSLFFSKGSGDSDVRFFAVFLSMLSTVLSFGLLSFSSFAPVSHLGISVSIGIILCFLLSFFLVFYHER